MFRRPWPAPAPPSCSKPPPSSRTATTRWPSRSAITTSARRPLLRDRAAELGSADRTLDADEQHAVGEHAEEVALREVGRGRERREEVGERGEEEERRAEGDEPV